MKKIPDFMIKDDEWFEGKSVKQKKPEQKRKPPLLTTEEFFEQEKETGWVVRVIDIAIAVTLVILLYLIFGSYL